MDLQQPLLNINSSSRSSTSTGVVLLPPTNNISTTTAATNSTLTAAAIENISTSSPSTSPTTSIVNHHHNHHHRNSQNHVTQKTNQVSTVLLYNIPIVSLYIEGQERLCLAQISNTLLKEFSYNEIHNRRVALGITCVQCTPVQLEILRRAGAMPVSSRRCGMITRREAERLCKSFLGDNTPPRLPEDFAFNVQHKCSWGCRGSFLPSRYNSSRAKCIKCHYCGMFFSPNKFIFHSHRIGPGDKYVQPDAANFNSWRRHMMLTGQPPQEVIYAWEDVKAMFNGGTRKRLMISNNSSPLPRVNTSSPGSYSGAASSNSLSRDHSTDDVNRDPLASNIKKNSNSVNTVTAAAAVVGVTAVAVGSTVRPLNLHFQASTAAGLTTESSYSVGTDMQLIPAAALSRSFMMDYMWQHARQAAESSYNQQYQQQNQPQQKVKSSNSAFSLPWINATIGRPSDIQNTENQHSNITYSSSANSSWSNSAATDITRNLSQIINTSAFKPVVRQQHHKKIAETSSSSTRSRRRHSTLQVSTYADDHCSSQTLTSSSQPAQNKVHNSLFSSDEDDNIEEKDALDVQGHCNNNDHKRLTTNHIEAPEDDILVDIETTEDEKPVSYSTNTSSFTMDNNESRDDIENSGLDNDKQAASDEDVIDVVHNDNDDTVLEFASLTPLTIIKHKSENYQKALSAPSDFASHNVTLTGSQELDQLYNIDRSNSENVPPPALSISPKSNSSSSCSRSSECFYVKEKNHYKEPAGPNPTPKPISRSPDTYVDQKIYFDVTNQEKSTKNLRKRPCEKTIPNYDKVTWRQINDKICNDNTNEEGQCDNANTVDSDSKYKKKSNQPNTKEVQLIEALTHKYELTYYNNNSASCKNNYINNNNNSPISNNNLNNVNNNEFWQMARLCMQRPGNFEQKAQHNQQQTERLPAFYYRQHQLHLSASEQHHQNSQTATFPNTQQVYLHLQQQSVQKTNNHYSNKIIQPPISNSSSHIPAMYVPELSDASSSGLINMHISNLDSINKANGDNGIG